MGSSIDFKLHDDCKKLSALKERLKMAGYINWGEGNYSAKRVNQILMRELVRNGDFGRGCYD